MPKSVVPNGVKRLALIIALLLSFGASASIGEAAGLLAYYPFNGNARDKSGNGNHATVSGATLTKDRDGNAKSAYRFDGVNDGIKAVVGADFSVTSLTLSAWIKITGPGDHSPRIVAVGPAGSPFQYYSLILENTSNSRRLWFYTGKSLTNAYSSFYLTNDNRWHFAAVTYSASANQVSFYLDGVLTNTVSVKGSLPAFAKGLVQIGYSDNGLDRFDGILDEIRIHGRAFSESEIKDLYTGEKPAEITSSSVPEVLTPGVGFDWGYQITPGTLDGKADLVVILLAPNNLLFFFTEEGVSVKPGPYRRGLSPGNPVNGSILYDLPFPSAFPKGRYVFATLLVRSGNIITDPNNWVSNLAFDTVYFAPLSPAQQALVKESGYPQRFIKSFSRGDSGNRVDETWTYAGDGVIRSFSDAVFMGFKDVPADAAARANSARPEHYSFDTSIGAVTARHGEPAAVQTRKVWCGTFTNYIYRDIAFGFLNNTLASVISAGPAPLVTKDTESWSAKTVSEPGEEGEGTAAGLSPAASGTLTFAALPAAGVNTGLLSTFASLLGAAAEQGEPGAREAFDRCMARIKTSAPTAGDLDCFRNALEGLSTASLEYEVQGLGLVTWLRSLFKDADQLESAASEPAPGAAGRGAPGQKGYASLTVTPGSAKLNDTVRYTFRVPEEFEGSALKKATISAGFSLPRTSMVRQTAGVYTFDWKVDWTDEKDFGDNLYALATADYGEWKFLQSTCALRAIKKSVGVWIETNFSEYYGYPLESPFTANPKNGEGPYRYQWNLAGEARASGPLPKHDIQVRRFNKPGTYPVSVTVTDARETSGSASMVCIVHPFSLKAGFSAQPSALKVGETGRWCVSASGGTPPYFYAFSGDGVAKDGLSNCVSHAYGTPGVKTLTVEVEDTADETQKTTIACRILVSGTKCDPETQTPCGTGCMPKGAWCCGGAGSYCTSGPCCGTGCCGAASQFCCGGTVCCNSEADCCLEKTGIAGCCAGGNCCPSGGCCPPGEECCGSGCCKAGSRCVGGKCVAG